jgi:YbaB/EbfC DNA-binding family
VWGDERALDEARQWIGDWQADIEQRATRAAELAERVGQLSGMARSRDGLVEVRLDSSGMLSGLRLDDQVRRYSGTQLAQAVLATVRAAQADLTEQVRRATAETVGADSETGRAVLASYANRLSPTGDHDGDR